MKKLFIVSLLFIFKTSFAQLIDNSWQQKNLLPAKGFIENKGQIKDQHGRPCHDVQYVFSEKNFNLVLKTNGFSYELFHYEKNPPVSEATGESLLRNENGFDEQCSPDMKTEVQRFDALFTGISNKVRMEAEEKFNDYSNYYIDNSAAAVVNVHSFKRICYRNIYPNIDLVFIAPGNELEVLKYEYIVHPGGNVKNIKTKYSSSSLIKLDDGSVTLSGSFGFVKEENLFVYQKDHDHPIASAFAVNGNILSVKVAAYDKNSELIIDPDIVWGSYYGDDFSDDKPLAIQVDLAGNEIISGQTASQANFVTSGAYQGTYAGGTYDAFVMKWNSAGSRIWCTYYGGNNFDACFGVYTDAALNVYCTGHTYSNNNPVFNAYQPTFGGNIDIFVLKLNKDGLIRWATYYGGTDNETSDGGIFGDTNGDIYFAGITESDQNISTPGSFQPLRGGKLDAFLAKFDSNGVRIWATYYGGSERDRGHAVNIDKDHNVIMTGTTPSLSGIATPGAHQTVLGGQEDMFVVKFTSGGARIWATYYGGDDFDHGRECDTDPEGNIYICGFTTSINNIASPGAFQTSWTPAYYTDGDRMPDGFFAKFDPNGVRLYGTYIGGNDEDLLRVLRLEADESIMLSGGTSSTGLGTNGVYQKDNAGGKDVFIAKFKNSGELDWFTYYGGILDDDGQGMDVDENGYIYVSGNVRSMQGIATPGAFKDTLSVGTFDDCMVAKFIDRCFDRYEPNNMQDDATAVAIPAGNSIVVNGEIEVSGDKDFYSFTNKTSAPNIKIQLTHLPKDYDIYLYRPSGQKAGKSTNKKKQSEQIVFNTNVVGTYNVKVQAKGTAAYNDTICYDLTISLSNTPFREQPGSSDTAIVEGQENQFWLYPNPAAQQINIGWLHDEESNVQIRIYNLEGKVMYSQPYNEYGNSSIDVGKWSEGIYFIEMKADGKVYRQKFIINR